MSNRVVALIDTDISLYRVLTTVGVLEYEEGDDEQKREQKLQKHLGYIRKRLDGEMEDILEKTNATHYIAFLSPKKTFRHTLARNQPYKAKRNPKPEFFPEARAHVIKRWKAIEVDVIESDDALSICQGEDTIICSIDKDLKQVPGWHYHLKHKEHKFITPEEGNYCLWLQVIMGDSTDTVQGIPGMGDVLAERFLAKHKPEDWPKAVLELYIKKFPHKGVMGAMALMVETYHLVCMLREECFGFIKPEPIPWTNPRKYDPNKDPEAIAEAEKEQEENPEYDEDDFQAMLDDLINF